MKNNNYYVEKIKVAGEDFYIEKSSPIMKCDGSMPMFLESTFEVKREYKPNNSYGCFSNLKSAERRIEDIEKIIESDIELISLEKGRMIIENYGNGTTQKNEYGSFIMIDNALFITIENELYSECNVEEFRKVDNALLWLLGESYQYKLLEKKFCDIANQVGSTFDNFIMTDEMVKIKEKMNKIDRARTCIFWNEFYSLPF